MASFVDVSDGINNQNILQVTCFLDYYHGLLGNVHTRLRQRRFAVGTVRVGLINVLDPGAGTSADTAGMSSPVPLSFVLPVILR